MHGLHHLSVPPQAREAYQSLLHRPELSLARRDTVYALAVVRTEMF